MFLPAISTVQPGLDPVRTDLEQGRRAEARQMLEEIYGWFTEGFETADLRDAASLLEELGVEHRAGC